MVVVLVVILCVLPLFIPFFSRLSANEGNIPAVANDFDGDTIVNTVDIDDDNDGIPDTLEIDESGDDIDSDGDGRPDRLDLDSDNDGILDWQESGALFELDLSGVRKVGPWLVGEIGTNGLIDAFESPIDTGILGYSLGNVDSGQDEIPDFLDLDSDNDGWPDFLEAGALPGYDSDGDSRVDIAEFGVGMDGVADILQRNPDQSCCDLDGDGDQETSPLNTDMSDLPDFQDLDSDNDGLFDLVELGGTDIDGDGRVDNFLDISGGREGPDGMDDGLQTFPHTPVDADGNGVDDHIDFTGPAPEAEADPEGLDPMDPDPTDPMDDPELAGNEPPLQSDPVSSGVVRTGLNSSGCSIQSARHDLSLLILSLLSIVMLVQRQSWKRRRNVS